jgi:uncharacterized membrane protein YdbT with pleckstrin-like domain
VGFPDSVLTSDEHVELHLHPHWKAMVRPVLVSLGLAAACTAAGVLLLGHGTGESVVFLVVLGASLVLFGWLSVWPWLTWRCTHYVFTNERVIMREGVLSREGRDIPLNRINDVSFQHNLLERMLGAGTLTIESAGERGQVVLGDIPGVERVQSKLYELVEAEHEAHTFDVSDRDAIVDRLAESAQSDKRERH